MHVFMFPGQSSADAGMLRRAMALGPAAQAVAGAARPLLGPALAARYLEGDVRLETNQDVQISVFLATQMHLAALRAAGVDADDSLGLSLGEYSHLVHIGALSFEDALRLVVARGGLYDHATPGTMVTIIGPDEETVAAVVATAPPRVVISNYNTPTQHVIAGSRDAVAWAAGTLEDEHGAMAVTIEERVPMHSPLMEEVAAAFRAPLAAAPWRTPHRPYRPNVLGAAAADAAPATFRALLAAHVSQPVRWRAAIERLAADRPTAVFIEVGPGRVLHNMLGRRWISAARRHTDAADGTEPLAHFAHIVEALHAGR